MHRIWMAAALLGAAAVLSSCDDFEGFDRARQDFHYSYAMQPGGRLEIDNTNGSVEITGWDRNTIDVSGTKYAPSDNELQDVRIKVDVNGSTASVRTESPKNFFHGSFGARYVIRVPRQTMLDRAETTNGSVSAEDLQGGGEIHSTNGRISLARDNGNYNVHTTNGTIELEEVTGAERAETTNGSIRGRLKAGAIDANSTNGSIDFTVEKPQDGNSIHVKTTNGGVTLALAEFHSNPITAETTHGAVTLRLPGDANAQIDAHTSFARITSDLPFSSTGEMSKHDLDAKLGSGGPQISVHTTTGGIRIEKY